MSLENEIKNAERNSAVEVPPYRPLHTMGPTQPQQIVHAARTRWANQPEKEAPVDYPGNPLFTRGKLVMHIPTRSTVTILKCEGVGRSGGVEYLVVNKKGKKWQAKETDLRPKPPKT